MEANDPKRDNKLQGLGVPKREGLNGHILVGEGDHIFQKFLTFHGQTPQPVMPTPVGLFQEKFLDQH